MNTKNYHYIEWFSWDHKMGEKGIAQEVELYDRFKDPFERENIANRPELLEVKKALAQQLSDGWRKAIPN